MMEPVILHPSALNGHAQRPRRGRGWTPSSLESRAFSGSLISFSSTIFLGLGLWFEDMLLRKMSSPDDTSSLGKDYDDGVYEKVVEVESQSSHYNPAHGAREQPPKLPTLMLASLVVLLISCFVGILLSGLHFGNTVHSGDCLGQSWVMFAVCAVLCDTNNSYTSASSHFSHSLSHTHKHSPVRKKQQHSPAAR